MKRTFRNLILLLCFCADVQFGADAEAIFYPDGCWGKNTPCGVENSSVNPLTLDVGGGSMHLDAHAILQKTGENEADLTRGILYAETRDFKWDSPFGSVLCKSCSVILRRTDNELEINTLKGDVTVFRRGDSQGYLLPPGFTVLLSTVRPDGRADLEFPQASPLRPLAKAWAKVYSGTRENFGRDLREYFSVWKEAVELASQMHEQEAQRRIASDLLDRKRDAEKLKRRHEEDERLRKLFRDKNEL